MSSAIEPDLGNRKEIGFQFMEQISYQVQKIYFCLFEMIWPQEKPVATDTIFSQQ